MARPGTQLVNRKALASASTPPYIKEVEALLESALQKSADAKSKEQKRTIKIPDLEKALGILNENAGTGQPNVEHLLALAEVNWELENAKESIAFLKEAIQLAPKDARPYGLLGRYLLNKGLRDQAMNFLDRAIQLDPDDHASRRLRDRAARQANKSYTVVVNAADLAAGAAPADAKAKAPAKKRAEATRLLDVDALKAGAVLEEADVQLQNEVDAALAALLGVSMTKADVSILEGQSKKKGAGGVLRAGCAFIVLAMMGLALGGVAWQLRPRTETRFGTPVQQALGDATAEGLDKFMKDAKAGAIKPTPEQLALAHAFLYADHGGDLLQYDDTVEALFPPAGRTPRSVSEEGLKSPEALLSRALVQAGTPRPKDATLDADLEAAPTPPGIFEQSWLQMARAERAFQRNQIDRAIDLLDDVALKKNAPPRAIVELARAYALKGEVDVAQGLLEHLWRTFPNHAPSLSLGVALAVDLLVKDRPKDAEDIPPQTPLEKRIIEAFEGKKIEGRDAAQIALVIAATHAARGDDKEDSAQPNEKVIGKMMTRVNVPATEDPALLSHLVELYLLRVQPPKAQALLVSGARLENRKVDLIINKVRAKLLGDLPQKALITLRAFTKSDIESGRLQLPGGALELSPRNRPFPYTPTFDPRYFPEREISNAIDVSDPIPNVVDNLLKNVADLKLVEILLLREERDKAEREENLAAAEKKLQAVVENRGDNNPRYYLFKAQLLRAQGNKSGAREAIEDALNIESRDPRILVAAARIQFENGDTRAGLKSLGMLEDEKFKSPTALLLRAQALRKGDDKARQLLRQAADLAPGNVALMRELIALDIDAGDFDSASKLAIKLNDAVADEEAMKEDPVAQALVARATFTRKKVKDADKAAALAQVEALAKANPKEPAVLIVAGDAKAGAGDTEAANTFYSAAAKAARGKPLADVANARMGDGEAPAPEKKPRGRKRRRGRRR